MWPSLDKFQNHNHEVEMLENDPELIPPIKSKIRKWYVKKTAPRWLIEAIRPGQVRLHMKTIALNEDDVEALILQLKDMLQNSYRIDPTLVRPDGDDPLNPKRIIGRKFQKKNLTKKDVQEAKRRILKFLAENPHMTFNKICQGLENRGEEVGAKIIFTLLLEMVEDGSLEKTIKGNGKSGGRWCGRYYSVTQKGLEALAELLDAFKIVVQEEDLVVSWV
jgi:DNA-binding PadR family transcriptional regulator